ncbi:ABC transporter ATPase [Metabacillus sp. HB246100]
MFWRISERNFYALRIPLESGRQSPQSLGGTLFLGIFMQALFFYLIYSQVDSSHYPNIDHIYTIHLRITISLIFLSFIYSIPYVYRRSQRIQYLISILSIQNAGAACMFIGAMIYIGEDPSLTEEALMNFTYITLAAALLLLVVTVIRFYILLVNGNYRKGSPRVQIRARFEIKTHLPIVIVGSTILIYILQFLLRNGQIQSLESLFLTLLPLLIFYTMIFVLPEQLVILYCKYRFKSFNFNERGYLYSSEGTKDQSSEINM